MFGTVKLVRSAIKNKFIYNGWGIAFDGEGSWGLSKDFARIVLIFGVDNTFSFHTDNQENNFFVLGEETTDDINDITGAAEKKLVLTIVKQMQRFV